jgi:tetratricopeptide (TPR) repeat protein
LQDVFAMQDQIAGNVAVVLQERLLGQAGASPVFSRNPAHGADPQAWELYLRGKYFLGRRMQGDLLRAHSYLKQALAIDPGLVPAWVALAANYNVRRDTTHTSAEEMLSNETARPLMRQALERALALDPDNPEALLRMSGFTIRDGDRELGLEQIERAMRNGRNERPGADDAGRGRLRDWRRGGGRDAAAAGRRAGSGEYRHSGQPRVHAVRSRAAARGCRGLSKSMGIEAGKRRQQSCDAGMDRHPQRRISRGLPIWPRCCPRGPWRDQAETMLAFRSGDSDGANKVLERLQQSQESRPQWPMSTPSAAKRTRPSAGCSARQTASQQGRNGGNRVCV